MSLSIVVPTLNEGRNLKELIKRLDRTLRGKSYEILIIDKFSADNTKSIVQKLTRIYPVKFYQVSYDLSNSVIYGFKKSQGKIIVIMDGDLSHPPEFLPKFLARIEKEGCDLVVGTRRKAGGRVEDWPFHRRLVSRLGEIMARPLVGKCTDPMSGFFVIRRSVIEGIKLSPIGYKILIEILVKGKYKKYDEVPYVFKNRKRGSSKLNTREFLRYLMHLARLYLYFLGIR